MSNNHPHFVWPNWPFLLASLVIALLGHEFAGKLKPVANFIVENIILDIFDPSNLLQRRAPTCPGQAIMLFETSCELLPIEETKGNLWSRVPYPCSTHAAFSVRNILDAALERVDPKSLPSGLAITPYTSSILLDYLARLLRVALSLGLLSLEVSD